MGETKIMRDIQVEASARGSRLWRNNVGLFETADRRKIRTGLCPGSSDLIGYKPLVITPELAQKLIGTKIAIFVACEVKDQRGRLSKEQAAFLTQVAQDGGIAFVAKSKDEIKPYL